MKGIFLINSAFVSVSIIYPKSFQFKKKLYEIFGFCNVLYDVWKKSNIQLPQTTVAC